MLDAFAITMPNDASKLTPNWISTSSGRWNIDPRVHDPAGPGVCTITVPPLSSVKRVSSAIGVSFALVTDRN